jgi:hypothetical protein
MPLDVSERSILEALHRIPQEHWGHVLEFLHDLEPKAAETPPREEPRRWTIAELLTLPSNDRNAILEMQAALAENDYRNDPELTAFDAFGPDDLYVDDADTAAW